MILIHQHLEVGGYYFFHCIGSYVPSCTIPLELSDKLACSNIQHTPITTQPIINNLHDNSAKMTKLV